jgi:hypothetical protein
VWMISSRLFLMIDCESVGKLGIFGLFSLRKRPSCQWRKVRRFVVYASEDAITNFGVSIPPEGA